MSRKRDKAGSKIIDIAKFITDDVDDGTVEILEYLDEVAQRKKGAAPVLVLKPEYFGAG